MENSAEGDDAKDMERNIAYLAGWDGLLVYGSCLNEVVLALVTFVSVLVVWILVVIFECS